MDLVDLIESKQFLGSEFLLWLWFKSECYEGLFELPELGNVEVWFDDSLQLEAYLAETERNTFKGGSPAFSPEAKTALQQGKRPKRAKLCVIREGREWTFKMKAPSMDLTTVKIPSLLSREEEEQFYERMYLLEEIEDIVAALYHEFLTIRLSEQWVDAMLPAMREWVHLTDEHCGIEAYPTAAVEPLLEEHLGTHERVEAYTGLDEPELTDEEKEELAAMAAGEDAAEEVDEDATSDEEVAASAPPSDVPSSDETEQASSEDAGELDPGEIDPGVAAAGDESSPREVAPF